VKDVGVTFTVFEGFVAKDSASLVSSSIKTLPLTTNANGIAECYWRTATAPSTQQLRAEINGLPAGLALGAHREVLFTANIRPGKDCCVTVGAGGDFALLKNAIEALERSVKEICICLLPGDHIVPLLSIVGATASALPITGGTTADALPANVTTTAKAVATNGGTPPPIVLRHLHIHGCGRSSRILLGQTLKARSLDSITLQDLCIYADVPVPMPNGAPTHEILIEKCKDVTITGCHLRQQNTQNDWIIISEAEHINIADNVIESSATITVTVAGTDTLVTNATAINVRAIAETAAANLAGKKKSERAAFIKEFRKIVKEVPPDDPKKKPLAAALKHLSAKRSVKRKSAPGAVDAPMTASIETPQGLADSVIGFVGNGFFLLMPALVIADAKAETAIVNNVIRGEVRIYGGPSAVPETVFDALPKQLMNPSGSAQHFKDVILEGTPRRSLRIEGNVLTNVVVGSSKMPNPPNVAGPSFPRSIADLFMRMSLLDNTFHALGNQWLAVHVISNGNHFVVSDSGLIIGTAIGASFICVGTSANWLLVTLQYGVPPVGTGQPQRFNQSANLINLTRLV
jgi:hypothetical protein